MRSPATRPIAPSTMRRAALTSSKSIRGTRSEPVEILNGGKEEDRPGTCDDVRNRADGSALGGGLVERGGLLVGLRSSLLIGGQPPPLLPGTISPGKPEREWKRLHPSVASAAPIPSDASAA